MSFWLIWSVLPLVLLADPTVMGLLTPHDGWVEFARRVGTVWLVLGVAGVVFRPRQPQLQPRRRIGGDVARGVVGNLGVRISW